MKLRLNTLEVIISSLKVECASLRWARVQLYAKVSKLYEGLDITVQACLQQSMEVVAEKAQVSENQLAQNFKLLESEFFLDGGKVSNEMKRRSKDFNFSKDYKVAVWAAYAVDMSCQQA